MQGEALESALLISQPRVPQKHALSPAACDLEATFYLPKGAWSHDQEEAAGPLSQGPSDWTSADNLGNKSHGSLHSV